MIGREEKIERGEVYYVFPSGVEVGSEQVAGRPAIIVSNDKSNEFSTVVEVVFLTTQEKTQLPTHVEILSLYKPSIALCEQISSISKTRLGKMCGKCTDEEIELIDKAICVSLGLEPQENPKEKPQTVNLSEELNRARLSIADKLLAIRGKAVKRAECATSENIDEYWTGFASAIAEAICTVNEVIK